MVNPGSGYTSAPTVTILDADQTTPGDRRGRGGDDRHRPDRRDLRRRRGTTPRPTVTITDTVGTADKGASATAMVAVKGAVTAINVTNPGAGYLTPGLKKFVDTLPGLGPTAANNLGQYIPVAVPDTTTYPGTDYYEIGGRPVPHEVPPRPAGHAAARLRPALHQRRARQPACR